VKEFLAVLDTLTPLWGVALAAFAAFLAYGFKLQRSKGHRWEVILSDSPVVIGYAGVAVLYFIFYSYDVAIEIRGPLARFAFISLFMFDALRVIIPVWWSK